MSPERVKCCASASAFLHVGLGAVGTIVFIILLVVFGTRDEGKVLDHEDSKVIIMCYLSALLVYFILMFFFSIALIMGLAKRKHPFMAPFVYLVYAGSWIYVLLSFRHFISGLWNRGPFVKLFVNLIINLVCATIQVLVFWPVYMLYKRWRADPPSPPERHGLEEAEPVNKPHMSDGADI